MKLKTAFIVLAGVIFFWVLAYSFSPHCLERTETLARANVTYNRIGFDVSNKSLNFGFVPIEGKSKRFLKVKNPYNFPVRADFFVSGNISDFIFISENHIILKPYQNYTLNVSFIAPSSEQLNDIPKYFEGSVVVELFQV